MLLLIVHMLLGYREPRRLHYYSGVPLVRRSIGKRNFESEIRLPYSE